MLRSDPSDSQALAELQKLGPAILGTPEAALALDPWFVPVDDAIVGLVDEIRNYSAADLDQ